MNIVAAIGLVVFALLAGFSFLTGARALSGSLPFRSALGLQGSSVIEREDAWVAAHRAAAPMFFAGAAFALIHAIGCGFVVVTSTESSSPLAVALVIGGAIVVAGFRWVAQSLAQKAAQQYLKENPVPLSPDSSAN